MLYTLRGLMTAAADNSANERALDLHLSLATIVSAEIWVWPQMTLPLSRQSHAPKLYVQDARSPGFHL